MEHLTFCRFAVHTLVLTRVLDALVLCTVLSILGLRANGVPGVKIYRPASGDPLLGFCVFEARERAASKLAHALVAHATVAGVSRAKTLVAGGNSVLVEAMLASDVQAQRLDVTERLRRVLRVRRLAQLCNFYIFCSFCHQDVAN